MKETITVEVGTYEVQKTINRYENFGWQLLSNQHIRHSEPISSSSVVDGLYIHENWCDDYSCLTFQRETKMRNYLELVRLERQYVALDNQLKDIPWIMKPKEDTHYIKEHRRGKIAIFFGVFFMLSGIYSLIARFCLGIAEEGLPNVVFILLAVSTILFGLALLFHGIESIQCSKENERKANVEYERQIQIFDKKKDEQNSQKKSIMKQMDSLKDKAWVFVDL
jgi:hypothetical protein